MLLKGAGVSRPLLLSGGVSCPRTQKGPARKPALLFSNAVSQVFPRPRMRVGEVGNCDIGLRFVRSIPRMSEASDALQVRVLERRRILEPVAERAVDADVRKPDQPDCGRVPGVVHHPVGRERQSEARGCGPGCSPLRRRAALQPRRRTTGQARGTGSRRAASCSRPPHTRPPRRRESPGLRPGAGVGAGRGASELVPLFLPVVGLVVVAVALPEAGLVVVEELEAP